MTCCALHDMAIVLGNCCSRAVIFQTATILTYLLSILTQLLAKARGLVTKQILAPHP